MTTELQAATINSLHQALASTAGDCVEAIVREVPGYDRAFAPRLRRTIEASVAQALSAFLNAQADPSNQEGLRAMREGAYRLGQGEALSGRSTDSLLKAYRVGARVSWDRFAQTAVACNEPAQVIAALAASTFAYIDELSAQSLSGHTQALSRRTRELARRRDQLTAALASGDSRATLEQFAETAQWRAPAKLAALVVDGDLPPGLPAAVGDDALWLPGSDGASACFINLAHKDRRENLRHVLASTPSCLGLEVVWFEAHESLIRARRVLSNQTKFDANRAHRGLIECHEVLPEMVLSSDPLATSALQERVWQPFEGISETKRDALAETLLTWLLLQGRRDEVAQALHVHPQTVRYRMNQLRDLFGLQLGEPRAVLEIILGLVAGAPTSMKEETRP